LLDDIAATFDEGEQRRQLRNEVVRTLNARTPMTTASKSFKPVGSQIVAGERVTS
jgi:hypothetical protein